MISWFLKKFFSKVIYVQVWEERLKVTLVEGQNSFDEQPYIAIETKQSNEIVSAIGNDAYALKSSDNHKVYNPFSHPRLLVGSFTKAEKVLQYAIQSVCKNSWLIVPTVVFQPKEKLEGGVSDVEARLYRELALGAGAREVYLHVGSDIPLHNFKLSSVSEPSQI